MKLIQIFGDQLSLSIKTTIPSAINNPALSFAINVKFIENGMTQEGKIIVHSRGIFTESIDHFTATLIIEETHRPCTGSCYHDGPIEEIWLTIIEPETKTISTNISKTDFIQLCKEYYACVGLDSDEDGNVTTSFSMFSNVPTAKAPTNAIRNEKYIIHKEIRKNLFLVKSVKDNEQLFGEYIDEYIIKLSSYEEGCAKGTFMVEE